MLKRVRDALTSRLSPLETKAISYIAHLGAADGSIYPDINNKSKVYVTDLKGGRHTVTNRRISNGRYWRWVSVGTISSYPNVVQVLDYIPNPLEVDDTLAGLVDHHQTHEFDSFDTVWVQGEQFLPWLVRPSWHDPETPSAYFSIDILPGLERPNGIFIFKSKETVNLSSHKPTSGAIFVIVCLDSSGVYTVIDGAPVSTPEIILGANIPLEPAGTVIKAIVRLYSGQSRIEQRPDYKDIFDPRFALGGGGGGSRLLLEDLTSQIDGLATHFTPAYSIRDGTSRVKFNGLEQIETIHYVVDVGGAGFTTLFTPLITDTLTIAYERA